MYEAYMKMTGMYMYVCTMMIMRMDGWADDVDDNSDGEEDDVN